jgi:hypothetical protein
MTMRTSLLLRFLLTIAVGMILATVFSEVAFRLQGNTISRPPRTVELVIPPGTSAQVAQGASTIPQDLVVVAGDTLLVRNRDTVAHTLGPLYIPSGSSATLTLSQVGSLSYACSFEPGKYFGLTVQEALTLGVRLEGIIVAGVPLGILIGLYSLIVRPLKKPGNPPFVSN